jgi:hypothetical protein
MSHEGAAGCVLWQPDGVQRERQQLQAHATYSLLSKRLVRSKQGGARTA